MMKTIMKPAFLMEEIAVDLMSIPIIAQNVYVLKVGITYFKLPMTIRFK